MCGNHRLFAFFAGTQEVIFPTISFDICALAPTATTACYDLGDSMLKCFLSGFLAGCLTILAADCTGAVVFSENMGTVSGTTTIASHTGWQNNGVLGFSGTGDVRQTFASSGYTGASGGANVFLTSSGNPSFSISGINTLGYFDNSFMLSFGAFKSSIASNMSELVLSYSTDGTNFTGITFPNQPTGDGTAVWRLISLSNLTLPTVNNLRLRFQNTGSTQFRIDDVSLRGTAVPEPSSLALLTIVGVGGVAYRRRRSQNRMAADVDLKRV